MTVQLDHLMVPARDKLVSARLLAELLGVPWSTQGVGPFAPVFVNDGFTIDFDQWSEPLPKIHYCFRVSESEFDAILGRIRARNIPFRSNVLSSLCVTVADGAAQPLKQQFQLH